MVLVLFDIDGTILSTNGAGRRAVTSAVQAVLGRNVDITDVSFSGRTDPAIMADILTLSGAASTDEMLLSCMTAYSDALASTLTAEDVVVLPGVMELLSRLTDRDDVHLGLVTGNLEDTAYCKLRLVGLDTIFAVGAFGSDHSDRNHLPGLATRRASEHFNHEFTADRAIVIGDTIHDVACSRHFGAHSIAVCTGRIGRPALERVRPDVLLDSLDPGTEVDEFVDSLLADSRD